MDGREMYAEVNALMGAIGKAFALDAEQTARAVEAGEITMDLGADERGERFVGVTYGDKAIRLYQGAIHYSSEAPAATDESCADGSCGCGDRGR